MSKLTIRRKRLHGRREYELSSNGIIVDGLTWDEMLGAIARHFILEWFYGLPGELHGQRAGWQIEYELHIEETDGLYLITHEDRFISHLTFDEMLGFIAQYTLIDRQMFSGLQTYQQWVQGPYRKKEIAGLLPVSTVTNQSN